MMKKIVTAVMLSGCVMFSATAAAQDIVDYAGGGLAIQDLDNFDMGLALVANAGKNIDKVHENFYVEGELTYSLLAPSRSFFGTDFTVRYLTLGAYAVYKHPIDSKISVRGRAGLLYASGSFDCDGCFGVDSSESDMEVSFGVGGDYELKNDMAVTADLTMLGGDLFHIGVGAKYHF